MNNNNQPFDDSDDMQEEYDFSGGVRGKYYRAYQQGYTIRIQQANGSVVEEHVLPLPRTVVLDPDVFAYFSDSDSVNQALRTLISIVPQKKSA